MPIVVIPRDFERFCQLQTRCGAQRADLFNGRMCMAIWCPDPKTVADMSADLVIDYEKRHST